MSVITVERPAAAAPAPSWSAGWWNLALRLVLLGVLSVAAVIALPSARPQSSTPGFLLDDLQSGRIHQVRFESQHAEVRWSDGWSQWYRASLEGSLPSLPASAQSVTLATEDSRYGTDQEWLSKAVYGLGDRRVDYQVVDGSRNQLSWARQLPWQGLSTAAAGAGLAAFFLMLTRREHRWGNRWAWLWMMAATSGLGIVLYLLLEPSPLWQKPSRPRPLPQRPVFLGGAGLLIALVMKPALALLALLVSAS
jgi:hypothetical protein